MANNILVIGNGFDLAHGRKTTYKDFVKCVQSAFGKEKEQRSAFEVRLTELLNVNGFFRHFHFSLSEDTGWTYAEQEMDNIIAALIRFEQVILENQKDPDYDPSIYNIIGSLFTYNDMQIFKHFARIFEQVYDDPSGGLFKLRRQYITPEKVLDRQALVAQVRRELAAFSEALDLYFTVCVDGDESSRKEVSDQAVPHTADAAKIAARMAAVSPSYVISFNHTALPVAYGIPDEKIFYAKGKAGSSPSALVIGSPCEPRQDLDWIHVNTEFLSLMKFTGLPDEAALYPKEGNEPIPVTMHVIGYSFPVGDAKLVRQLYDAAEQFIVYYKDSEDYARLMIRLMKLFGREMITSHIYSGRLRFEAL